MGANTPDNEHLAYAIDRMPHDDDMSSLLSPVPRQNVTDKTFKDNN